jgi:hypothetical protein
MLAWLDEQVYDRASPKSLHMLSLELLDLEARAMQSLPQGTVLPKPCAPCIQKELNHETKNK